MVSYDIFTEIDDYIKSGAMQSNVCLLNLSQNWIGEAILPRVPLWLQFFMSQQTTFRAISRLNFTTY